MNALFCIRVLVELTVLVLIIVETEGLTLQLQRRNVLGILLVPTSVTVPITAAATPSLNENKNEAEALVYMKLLGSGSFKSVYSVSLGGEECFALAVSRLTEKAAVKDEVRGIEVVEELQKMLHDDERVYFEKVYDWWFQATGPAEFVPNNRVFSGETSVERTRKKVPQRFLGSKWLVAIKPLYDLDLFAFCSRTSTMYPVGLDGTQSFLPQVVAGIPLSNDGAVHLVSQMLHAGSIMHSAGLVHRDIKPKNIMLSLGRPVIIDFGFAGFVDRGMECIEQPGRIKGEVGYVLANDAATYRGCKQGDVYAMAKTIYEVLYDAPHEAARQEITPQAARFQNEKFRAVLWNGKNDQSRFQLDQNTSDTILETLRGMCQIEGPLRFSEAERFLAESLSGVGTPK